MSLFFRQIAAFALLALCPAADACPWCSINPSMKPTVFEGDPDPGGKFFGKAPDPAHVRRYFIAAETEVWNFLPDGEDATMKNKVPPHILNNSVSGKSRYHQYTDDTFTTRVIPNERLGILGPVMRGVTGDFIVVTLLNRLTTPVSLHPHGVRYDKDSEGSSYFPGRGAGASIAPGARFTYVWQLDEASAPRADEPSSKPWLYHSHVSGDDETNAGLSGFIIVTDAARARPDGTPADVDREMALLLENYDESGFTEAQEYASLEVKNGKYPDGFPVPPPDPWYVTQELRELAMRHAINGRVFGNAKGFEMTEGERVRWYLFELGTDPDVHTAHWHGARLRDAAGHMTDVIELMPGTMKSADMLADNPGDWMIHCHVGDHMMEGMYATYSVRAKDSAPLKSEPFFGLPGASQSVEWTAAEANLEQPEFHFKATCKVSAYANLSAWTTHLGITLGKAKATTRLDRSGAGKDNGAEFRILNVDSAGVVQSANIELEIHLIGPQWADAFREAAGSKPDPVLSLQLQVDDTIHQTQIPLTRSESVIGLKR